MQNTIEVSNKNIEKVKIEKQDLEDENSKLKQQIKEKNDQISYLQKNYIEKLQKNLNET